MVLARGRGERRIVSRMNATLPEIAMEIKMIASGALDPPFDHIGRALLFLKLMYLHWAVSTWEEPSSIFDTSVLDMCKEAIAIAKRSQHIESPMPSFTPTTKRMRGEVAQCCFDLLSMSKGVLH